MTVYGNYDVIAFRSCIQILTVYRIQKPLTNLGGHDFPLFEPGSSLEVFKLLVHIIKTYFFILDSVLIGGKVQIPTAPCNGFR